MASVDFMVAYTFRSILESNYAQFGPVRLKKIVIESIIYVIPGLKLHE